MQPIAITSADDERIADYVRLTDVNLRRKLETERGLYLAEGDLVLRRAIAAGHVPRSVLVADSRADALETLPLPDDTAVYRVTDALAEDITGFHVHRGVIASMNRPPLADLSQVLAGARRVAILEDLTNHTNVGAIFRSAAALGADAVLVTPRCADPVPALGACVDGDRVPSSLDTDQSVAARDRPASRHGFHGRRAGTQ